jgi:hypothetical protein
MAKDIKFRKELSKRENGCTHGSVSAKSTPEEAAIDEMVFAPSEKAETSILRGAGDLSRETTLPTGLGVTNANTPFTRRAKAINKFW